MSVGTILLLVCLAGCLILFLILRSVQKELKNTQKELEDAQLEVIRKENELEVIGNVQEKLRTVRERKAPKKTDAPASGDSDSRIARLNGLSDGDGE